MQKKILYLNFVPANEKGVLKKINFQIKAMKKLGMNVEIAMIKDNFFLWENRLKHYYKYGDNIFSKLKNKIDELYIFSKLKNKKFYQDIDIIYLRYIRTTPWSLSYYKFLKKLGKKVVIEIPTYPYDEENKKKNIFDKLDKKYRLKLYKYVNKIVTYSDDKEIWKIPCINIFNGIDLDEVDIITKKLKNNNKITFTSVSNCSFWHGIDRFLYSILEYKKNFSEDNIVFNIVGEGKETSKLKKIVDENPVLKENIIFHGFKSGKELDEIYNQTDIAVGCLGCYRKGIEKVSSLKNIEYCAKGLPMIFSEIDERYIGKKFVFKVANDDSEINLLNILKWYKNLEVKPEEIRSFSLKYSWNIQVKKIMENI